MRVIDAVNETIAADVSRVGPSSVSLKKGQRSKRQLLASNNLINTQLIHQFVFRRADTVI